MLLPLPSTVHSVQDPPPTRKKRRGVTSLEYVFIVSLILVACIIGIQQVGEVTRTFFTTSAEKTKIMDPSQQNQGP